MEKFYELLQEIKKRPGMYLGNKSLELLSTFLGGYASCLWCSDLSQSRDGLEPDSQKYVLMPGFQEYVQKEYGTGLTPRSWATIIASHSPSDEEAFDTFFDLLDKYLKVQEEFRCSRDIGSAVQLELLEAPDGMGVTWTSSDPNVATVDVNGYTTTVGSGTCTITATTADGSRTVTGTLTVIIPVHRIFLGLTLAKKATFQLTSTVLPDNAANKKVTWSTDEPTVATVDATGKVTAVAAGTAVITVTTEDGGKTAACTVTVTETKTA